MKPAMRLASLASWLEDADGRLPAGRMRPLGQRCRDCGAPMVERQTKDGRKFHGCLRFPECKGGEPLITRRLKRRTRRGRH